MLLSLIQISLDGNQMLNPHLKNFRKCNNFLV